MQLNECVVANTAEVPASTVREIIAPNERAKMDVFLFMIVFRWVETIYIRRLQSIAKQNL